MAGNDQRRSGADLHHHCRAAAVAQGLRQKRLGLLLQGQVNGKTHIIARLQVMGKGFLRSGKAGVPGQVKGLAVSVQQAAGYDGGRWAGGGCWFGGSDGSRYGAWRSGRSSLGPAGRQEKQAEGEKQGKYALDCVHGSISLTYFSFVCIETGHDMAMFPAKTESFLKIS